MDNSGNMQDDYNNDNQSVMFDDDGNPIPKENDKKDQEPEEPEEPLPEITNPIKFDQLRLYLFNLTKTFSGMSYAYTTFNCSEKEIDQLPDELNKFIHLRDINISKNKVLFIKGFEKMLHLCRFDGSQNDIRDMTCFSYEEGYKFLQKLILSNNKIKILPALYCDNLIELHLDNNQVKNAKAFIRGLKKLKLLNLNTNKLKNCTGIGNCPSLETLKLNENEITSLEGLENLPSLRCLEVSSNQIEKINFSSDFSSLTKVLINSNKVSDLKEFNKLKLPNIHELNNLNNPCIDELGGGTKIEMVMIFEGYDLKLINEEEITKEDIQEAKEKKEERARIAEEERIQREKEEEERRRVEEEERIQREKEEEERRRVEEEERIQREKEEEERRQMEMNNSMDNAAMNDGDQDINDHDQDKDHDEDNMDD